MRRSVRRSIASLLCILAGCGPSESDTPEGAAGAGGPGLGGSNGTSVGGSSIGGSGTGGGGITTGGSNVGGGGTASVGGNASVGGSNVGGQTAGGSATGGSTTDGGGVMGGSTADSGGAGGEAPDPCTLLDCDDGNPCTDDGCDQGSCTHVAAAIWTLPQAPGDCQEVICDGTMIASADDNADPPLDDGNVCTLDLCEAGSPAHPAVTNGTLCNDGACFAGVCSDCADETMCGIDTVCADYSCDLGSCVVDYDDGAIVGGQGDGDCAALQCVSGNPDPVSVAFNDPLDDSESCTIDGCSGTLPTHTPVTNGAVCADPIGGQCSAGACVDCFDNDGCENGLACNGATCGACGGEADCDPTDTCDVAPGETTTSCLPEVGLVFRCGDDTLPIQPSNCTTPIPLTLPTTLRGSSANHPSGYTGKGFAYSVVVPAGETLVATMRNKGPTYLSSTLSTFTGISPTCGMLEQPLSEETTTGTSPYDGTVRQKMRDTWVNTTGAAQTVFVTGTPNLPAFELDVRLASHPNCNDQCGHGQACDGQSCVPLESCPVPRVTMPDGACGTPDFTSAFCGCGGSCGPLESCIGGTCVPSPPGERCENPLDVPYPDVNIYATLTGARAADKGPVDSLMGASVYAVDATIRWSAPLPCRYTFVHVNRGYGFSDRLSGWLLIEAFDESGCTTPLKSTLIRPWVGPSGDAQHTQFVAPDGMTRMRLQYISLDDQGPISFRVYRNHLAPQAPGTGPCQ